MTEQQYINATNRTKVSIAINVLRDVLVTGDCVIKEKNLKDILIKLTLIESDLFKIVNTEG